MLVGVVAAVVGLGGAYLVLSDGSDEPAARSETKTKQGSGKHSGDRPAPKREDRSDWETEDRLEKLEDEVAELRAQLQAVKIRSGARGFASADGPEMPETGDPMFQDSVREIVADEREREREEEMDRRREMFKQRTDEALDELTAQAGMNDGQREKIATLWNEERDQMFSMFMEARAGERDFRELRQEARALRESTDEQAKTVLSDEQLQVYDELRPRGPGGRGPGGGRGPQGGRPPG